MKRDWIKYILIALILEKIIQHVFVSLAFFFNWGAIGSTVVADPGLLMVLGALVAVLFILALWGMIARQSWAMNLVIALAVFDIVGEFVAQGKIMILITVSFMIAVILLILGVSYRSKIRQSQLQT